MSRFVRPETVRLEISNGDWLLVKKRLNTGEERARLMRMSSPRADGGLRRDPLKSGAALISAYLLDWSLTDDDGKPVRIDGLSADELMTVLDGLDPDSFGELGRAIDAHMQAMDGERETEKKTLSGVTSPKAISPSPSDSAGIPTGSVN